MRAGVFRRRAEKGWWLRWVDETGRRHQKQTTITLKRLAAALLSDVLVDVERRRALATASQEAQP